MRKSEAVGNAMSGVSRATGGAARNPIQSSPTAAVQTRLAATSRRELK